MAEENKDVQVVQRQETVEVVGLDSNTNSSTTGALNSIFDKIEAGKNEGRTSKQVIAEQKETVTEEKKPEPRAKPEPVAEKKAEASDLDKKLADRQQKKDDDEEVTRESLRAKKEEAKEKPADKLPAPEEKKEDEVPEDELKVLPHDKPKTAKRIQALLKRIDSVTEEATKTKAEAAEKASKLADLEKKLGEVKSIDPATEEKVQKQLDELSMLRRRYELDNDPEVKTKFDQRMDSAEASIVDVLTKRNAGKALIELIKEEGGFNKFANSTRQLPISDGEGGLKYLPASDVADQILQALPLGERKAIEAAMVEQVQTKRDRDRFFKEQQETASKYFKEREESNKKQHEEGEKQIAAARKTIDEYVERQMKEPWLADKEVAANATAAEKAQIEEYNKYNKQLRGLFKKAVGTKDLDGLLEMITDSVRYFDERRRTESLNKENERLKADLKAKQGEIDKIKAGGRSVPRNGSISTAPTAQDDERKAPASLEETLERMERGERFGKRQVLTSDE